MPYLAEALKHKDRAIAYNAASALSRIGRAAASAVDELSAALTHKDKFVRRYCAQALGASGATAVKALPALDSRNCRTIRTRMSAAPHGEPWPKSKAPYQNCLL